MGTPETLNFSFNILKISNDDSVDIKSLWSDTNLLGSDGKFCLVGTDKTPCIITNHNNYDSGIISLYVYIYNSQAQTWIGTEIDSLYSLSMQGNLPVAMTLDGDFYVSSTGVLKFAYTKIIENQDSNLNYYLIFQIRLLTYNSDGTWAVETVYEYPYLYYDPDIMQYTSKGVGYPFNMTTIFERVQYFPIAMSRDSAGNIYIFTPTYTYGSHGIQPAIMMHLYTNSWSSTMINVMDYSPSYEEYPLQDSYFRPLWVKIYSSGQIDLVYSFREKYVSKLLKISRINNLWSSATVLATSTGMPCDYLLRDTNVVTNTADNRLSVYYTRGYLTRYVTYSGMTPKYSDKKMFEIRKRKV